MKYKSFKHVLARQPYRVRQLLDKVEEIRCLNELLQQFLDPFLAPHCQVANYRSGCLVIMADSAAWATRLRYAFPDLLGQLRYAGRLTGLLSLHCIVQKKQVTPPAPTYTPLSLSLENAALFEDLSKAESDSDLAEAIKKLAAHGAAPSR